MKLFITLLSFVLSGSALQAQFNLQLRAVVSDSTKLYANVGGWMDSLGNEYALLGTTDGLRIVDVTNPSLPVILFDVPGVTSNWREVKTWLHYAYVTNENGGGLQIINLQYLPDSVQVRQWQGDSLIAGLETIHALHIDSGTVYLYGCGTGPFTSDPKFFNGAAVLCDLLADPWNPHYLGHTTDFGFFFPSYVHDGFVSNDTLWAAHIWQGVVNVWDCTNKSLPVLLQTRSTPGAFTHNTWLSDDHSVLLATDEIPDSYLSIYDASDISNINLLSTFKTAPGSNATVHNTHYLDGYAVTSWYTEGVVITDVSRPANPIEVGKYDTTPDTGGSILGCWGVYPYLPSGTVLASDISGGLFIFTPTYVRGCYLEGIVVDSMTNFPLHLVQVTIDTMPGVFSKLTGEYKTGIADSGTYTITFSKAGYVTKTVSVTLANGQLVLLNVQLVPVGIGIKILDAASCLEVYPNPAPGQFVIRYDLSELHDVFSFVITDELGRQVEAFNPPDMKGEWKTGRYFAPGVYFLWVVSDGLESKPVRLISSR